MATLITKRGNGVPTAANLVEGEQAIDLQTGRVYTLSGGVVIECGADPHVIDFITDVDTTTTAPADGEVLTFDGATNLWMPQPAAGGSNVDKPYIIDPTNSQTQVPPSGPFEATTFGSNVGSLHASSDWVVYSNAALTTVAYQATGVTGTEKTILTTASGLTGNTTYYIQVRYNDNLGNSSEYSNVVSFTTAAVGSFINIGAAATNTAKGNAYSAYSAKGTVPYFFSSGDPDDQRPGSFSADFGLWGILPVGTRHNLYSKTSYAQWSAQSKFGNVYLLGSAYNGAVTDNTGNISTNGGYSWTKRTFSGPPRIAIGSVTSDTVMLMAGGRVSSSHDLYRCVGASVSTKVTGFPRGFSGNGHFLVAKDPFNDNWIAGVVGEAHELVRSTDDGNNWTVLTNNWPGSSLGEQALDEGACYMNGNFIYGFQNSFTAKRQDFVRYNWTNATSSVIFSSTLLNSSFGLQQMTYFIGDGTSAIMWDTNTVVITRDAGATWTLYTAAIIAAIGGAIQTIGSDGTYFYAKSASKAVKFL